MDSEGQRHARRRADRIAAFREELAELEREQGLVLTAGQRSQLAAHHERVLETLARRFDVDVSESARRVSWGMRIAALLGGVAFFTALVLFLHRVWGVLPSWSQVTVLVVVPLLLLAAAEFTFHRQTAVYYTALLAIAAGVAFVQGLTFLGGLVNAVPSPHALLAWAAVGLLLAYAYGLRLLLAAGLVVACAYTGSIWVAGTGGFWAAFPEQTGSLIPAAVVCYALPSVRAHRDSRGFDAVYRLCGGALALLALLIMSKQGDLCCAALPGRMAETVYQLVGMAGSVAVIIHGLRLGTGGLVNLGAGAFVVFLFVRLHAWWWAWMPRYLFFLLLGLIAAALLLGFRRTRIRLAERGRP